MLEKLLMLAVVAAVLCAHAQVSASEPAESRRKQARDLKNDGNFRDAADIFETLALDTTQHPKDAGADLADAILCKQRVGLTEDANALLDKAEQQWSDGWRMLMTIASFRGDTPHSAPILPQLGRVDIRRPPRRPRLPTHISDSQRIRALRLFLQAEKHLGDTRDPASAEDKQDFYNKFSDTLILNRGGNLSWRLTARTNLDAAPDDIDDRPFYSWPQRPAPVGKDDQPIYYSIPASWEKAKNDGERWRWLLEKMAESETHDARDAAELKIATFLFRQFGVHTITQNAPLDPDAALGRETGPFAVRTLGEDETIARLATGLRRFTMPHEFNYIRIFRAAAESGNPEIAIPALTSLAQIFENRQQYTKAVTLFEQLKTFPKPDENDPDFERKRSLISATQQNAERELKLILGNNGLIEAGPIAPAGSKTSLSYLFRNGNKARFSAKRLDEKKLIGDIRNALRSDPNQLISDWLLLHPETLGRRVVEKDEEKYIAETTAEWDVALDPLPDHYSRRTTVELPFDKAGCYLVEAAMDDGNNSRIVLWIQELALVKKSAGNSQVVFVADAATGDLLPGVNLSFLGFDRRLGIPGRERIPTEEFAERTDVEGLAIIDTAKVEKREWLITAETDDGRLAYLGFDSIWRMGDPEVVPDNESFFIITDRPVYRPGQDINFKLWYGYSDYSGRPHQVSGKPGKVIIRDPRGETVYEKTLTTDDFGGAADTLTLGKDAPLGQYYMFVDGSGGGSLSFRLEEYKKPEFEVSLDTPEKTIQLGDAVQLKARAKYYFGAPVQDGTVAYKIVRTPFEEQWTPPWRWDWLYGAGAWQRDYDYSWYPGFGGWGIRPPLPPWMPPRFSQPEIVAEGEGELDEEGVLRITLDTASAKELFGNQDHSYEVSLEVTDKSRRVITGGGKVVAARNPFAVKIWTNRGYYHVGEKMSAHISASTPTGGGVQAKGTAVLYRIRYDDKGVPAETATTTVPVETDSTGNAKIDFEIQDAGQYRLACKLENKDKNVVEGASLLTVRGEPGEGDFRFSALELIPDQRDYKPGDTVRLAVNSENREGAVLFFPRVERNGNNDNAAFKRPNLLRLTNGSHIEEIPVSRADRPNFFCEALMVYKGRLYSEVREIFVPPADRTLNVEIESDKTEYGPGGKAEFTVRVTETNGEPVVGQCVVSIYDRAVEYISGGSNIGNIRSHFWNWRRFYSSSINNSLDRSPFSPPRKGDVNWRPIGVFGSQEADWNDTAVYTNGRMDNAPRTRSMARMEFGGAAPMPAPMVMASAAMGAADMAVMNDAEMAVPETAMAKSAGGANMDNGMVEPSTRSDFADTALWLAALETDADGRATFSVDMPENLTAWKVRTWVMGRDTRVGDGQEEVETKKNVIVRPQAPRFLTQKDQVVLSANLHNYLPRGKDAKAELVLEGGLLELAAESQPLARNVRLDANGEARVDWIVNAKRPGEAKVAMRLLTDEESDAAEITVPVIVHGARRVEGFGGIVPDGQASLTIPFTVPDERLPDQSRLELNFSPNIATSLLEALPYVIRYPYGCTEQTLNRFLPAIMTRRFLDEMDAGLADARKALETKRDDAQSKKWREQWGDPRAKIQDSPVFDDIELSRMVKEGVDRLLSMQNADGGWGWFSGAQEKSWPHTTAVIMHGLQSAVEAGAAVPPSMIERGVNWLTRYQSEQVERLKIDPNAKTEEKKDNEKKDDELRHKSRADSLDAFMYMILARDNRRPLDPEMRDFLYRDRLDLSQTGLVMLGLGLHYENATNALEMVTDNLRQYLRRDPETGSVWLATPQAGWWWWYNDNIETQAWYLKLLSRINPKSSDASGVARYLLRNRKNGSYWRSTRDTAYAVEALAEYSKASGESNPDMTVTVYLDDAKVMERTLTAANLLDENKFVLEGLAVESGSHELRLERAGEGNVYFGGGLDMFSLEDPIRAAGHEVKVTRTFTKLVKKDKTTDMATASGVAVQGRIEAYERVELPLTGDVALTPGDLVEVELEINALNDYEYLVFEDMKAAGLEAVELQSGYGRADGLGAYIEYRDQKVAIFVRYVPKGKHRLRYRFRAEVPGSFSALPTFGGGMYATDLFTNSDEAKIVIGEKDVYEKK